MKQSDTPHSRFSMPPITYISEQPQDYCEALDHVQNLNDLREMLKAWKLLAADALEIANGMTEENFSDWAAGHFLERKGEFAGEEYAAKFGAIDMPAVLFKVSMVAYKFGAPWGCAYIRLKETGNLERLTA